MESFQSTMPSPDKVPPSVVEVMRSREAAEEVLHVMAAVPEFKLSKNSAILTDLPAGHLVVRREDPERIIELMKSHEPIPISFVGDTAYANCVEWDPSIDGTRGLDNAYLEGYSHKEHIVTVYGFKKPEDFRLESLDNSQRVFNGVDRSRVRAASGFVPFEAVQFVTVRIPINALPEEKLSEEERDQLYDFENGDSQKSAFIYRTYLRKEDVKEEGVTLH